MIGIFNIYGPVIYSVVDRLAVRFIGPDIFRISDEIGIACQDIENITFEITFRKIGFDPF